MLLGSARSNVVRDYCRGLLCGALGLRQKGQRGTGVFYVMMLASRFFMAAEMPGS